MMKIKFVPPSLDQITHALTSVAIVFALTAIFLLVGFKTLGEGVIALLYLVPMAWCTLHWGQTAGVSAALTAALTFDYFFIPPYNTFNIGSTEGWLMIFLLITASSLVVGRIRAIYSEVLSREQNATFLYEMVSAITSQPSREAIAENIASQIQQKYLAQLVQVHLHGRGRFSALSTQAAGNPNNLPNDKADLILPIFLGPELIGEILVWKGLVNLPTAHDPMVRKILYQTAMALDRVQNNAGNILQPV